jgi:hypothetical protein
MDDYDYDDEKPSVPTFSEGSIAGRRGAISRATASRASASKSAISIASKASAIIAASIQTTQTISINPSSHIHNNQHRTIALNTPLKNIPQFNPPVAPQNDFKFHKITNPIPLSQPRIPPQLPENPKPNLMLSINNFIQERYTPKSNKNEIIYNIPEELLIKLEETYRTAIKKARDRKLELLSTMDPLIMQAQPLCKPVKYIVYNTLTEDTSINKEALEKLIDNLRSSFSLTDKVTILDDLDKYQISMRISIEEPNHKRAFQRALINKALYLTSDA